MSVNVGICHFVRSAAWARHSVLTEWCSQPLGPNLSQGISIYLSIFRLSGASSVCTFGCILWLTCSSSTFSFSLCFPLSALWVSLICPYIYRSIHPSIFRSFYLFVFLSEPVYLHWCPSRDCSIELSNYVPVCMSVCMSVWILMHIWMNGRKDGGMEGRMV